MMQRQVGAAAMLRHRAVAGFRAALPEIPAKSKAKVVRMQHEHAARPHDAPNVGEKLSTILAAPNHSERAEQAGRIIKTRVGKFIQFNQVRLKACDVHSRTLGLFAHDGEHRFRKIDAKAREAAASKVEEQAARPTAEIDESTGRGEEPLREAQIDLQQRRAGECRVVLARRLVRSSRSPRARDRCRGKLPVGGHEGRGSGARSQSLMYDPPTSIDSPDA